MQSKDACCTHEHLRRQRNFFALCCCCELLTEKQKKTPLQNSQLCVSISLVNDTVICLSVDIALATARAPGRCRCCPTALQARNRVDDDAADTRPRHSTHTTSSTNGFWCYNPGKRDYFGTQAHKEQSPRFTVCMWLVSKHPGTCATGKCPTTTAAVRDCCYRYTCHPF